MILALFWLLALGGCGYVAAFGGGDGKWAAFLILLASILSVPAILLGRRWATTELGLMAVDTALLLALYVLSLNTRRYFPVWMTGFQVVAVTTHVATIIAPGFAPRVYQGLEQFWAIPVILVMIIGVSLDAKTGIQFRENPSDTP